MHEGPGSSRLPGPKDRLCLALSTEDRSYQRALTTPSPVPMLPGDLAARDRLGRAPSTGAITHREPKLGSALDAEHVTPSCERWPRCTLSRRSFAPGSSVAATSPHSDPDSDQELSTVWERRMRTEPVVADARVPTQLPRDPAYPGAVRLQPSGCPCDGTQRGVHPARRGRATPARASAAGRRPRRRSRPRCGCRRRCASPELCCHPPRTRRRRKRGAGDGERGRRAGHSSDATRSRISTCTPSSSRVISRGSKRPAPSSCTAAAPAATARRSASSTERSS